MCIKAKNLKFGFPDPPQADGITANRLPHLAGKIRNPWPDARTGFKSFNSMWGHQASSHKKSLT